MSSERGFPSPPNIGLARARLLGSLRRLLESSSQKKLHFNQDIHKYLDIPGREKQDISNTHLQVVDLSSPR
jgi:hypothetical protein